MHIQEENKFNLYQYRIRGGMWQRYLTVTGKRERWVGTEKFSDVAKILKLVFVGTNINKLIASLHKYL